MDATLRLREGEEARMYEMKDELSRSPIGLRSSYETLTPDRKKQIDARILEAQVIANEARLVTDLRRGVRHRGNEPAI
jgi:hypothetical protein